MKIAIKITKWFFVMLSIISVLVCVSSSILEIGYYWNYVGLDMYNYTFIGEVEKSYPIYFVKNLEVDKNGNFYISCADGIMIYDKNGSPLHHIFIRNDFAFKLEDYQIKVVVKENDKNITVYSCDIHSDGRYYDFDFVIKPEFEENFKYCEFEEKNVSFNKYINENDYKSSVFTIKNNKKYCYIPYGKIIDSNNKITSLSASFILVNPRFSLYVFVYSLISVITLWIIERKFFKK